MRHGTFIWFFLPTASAMIFFIAFPLLSVLLQAVHAPHKAILIEVETCVPLVGCKKETTIDQESTRKLREAKPLGRFVGTDIIFDRGHLAINEVQKIWSNSDSWKTRLTGISNLPFYRAMAFTLTFTFFVTPFVILIGFLVAMMVNAMHSKLKGFMIFFSLLPFVVTPLIGALVLFWMIDSRGILGSAIQWMTNDPGLSLKASTGLMWLALIIYGIWHAAPFAFIIFYAGLQTLPSDQLEAAQIDGASRWQQIRYVTIPHLMPLITFVALIQLMDNFRVFEPIVGFNAAAHAQSLSWFIFNDLGGETRQFSAASASSILTIIGVSILLTPVLYRTWQDFKGKI